MIDNLPIDIIRYVSNFLDSEAQMAFVNLATVFKTNIHITNFNVRYKFSSIITNDVLNKYTRINHLNLYDNKRVNNISHLKYITMLNISGSCKINQNNINHLINLTELDISNNINIHKVSIFTQLKKLHLCGVCNVSVDEINRLHNLEYINLKFNPDAANIINNLKKKNIINYNI
jgi:hypothetical protein